MKSLFQLFSAPVAAIALCLILAIVGGLENGTIPFSVGAVAACLMVVIEVVAIRAITKRENEEAQ